MNEDEFWAAIRNMPEPEPVTFRLYYNSTGHPLFYSMEHLPGTYIEVDAETFALGNMRVRVRDNKIVPVTWKTTVKLIPNDTGTPCHPDDVSIVVPETYYGHQKWSKQTYESN